MTRHQKRMLKQAAKQICLHILFIVICFVTLIPILYALSVATVYKGNIIKNCTVGFFECRQQPCELGLPFYPEELHAAELCCGLYRRTCHAVV